MLFSATLDGAVDGHRPAFPQPSRPRHSVDTDAPPPDITHHLLTVTSGDRVHGDRDPGQRRGPDP